MLAPISVPRDLLDPDIAVVHCAAGILQIPEFAFFHLAYRRWHGRGVSDQALEPVFMGYLYRRRVPPWVRHLAREVQERSRTGRVVPEEYGVEPTLPPPTSDAGERFREVFLTLAYGICFMLITFCAL